jgi:cell division protein FtsB
MSNHKCPKPVCETCRGNQFIPTGFPPFLPVNLKGSHILLRRAYEEINRLTTENQQLKAENKRLVEQLREGHHCTSFGMCGEAGEKYEKEIALLKARVEELERDNKRLREFIIKNHPPNRHDHNYFHDDCFLCQIEKRDYEKVEQALKESSDDK